MSKKTEAGKIFERIKQKEKTSTNTVTSKTEKIPHKTADTDSLNNHSKNTKNSKENSYQRSQRPIHQSPNTQSENNENNDKDKIENTDNKQIENQQENNDKDKIKNTDNKQIKNKQENNQNQNKKRNSVQDMKNNKSTSESTDTKNIENKKTDDKQNTAQNTINNAISQNETAQAMKEKVDQGKKTVEAAKNVAKTTGTVFRGLISLVVNPVTWIIFGILILVLVFTSGSQILGKSDFANNCSASGSTQLADQLDPDSMKAAKQLGDWFANNPIPGVFGDKPLSKIQIAAMMGNAYQESKIKPQTIQGHYADVDEYYKTCDNDCIIGWDGVNGKAIGLWQMDGGRRKGIAQFAKETNRNWYDVNLQLDWFKKEASESPYEMAQLKKSFVNCTTIEECTIAFCRDYERAGTEAMDTRVSFAKKFLEEWSPSSGSSGFTSSGSVSSCSGTAGLDTSDVVGLAVSIAYPNKDYAKANVSGGDNWGRHNATEGYKKAKAEAQINGGADSMAELYASCDRFVATVYKATKKDTEIPWGPTTTQYNYFKSSPKWEEVGCSDRKPGDVVITRGDGHIMLYVGMVEGKDSIADASYLDRVAAISSAPTCSGKNWNTSWSSTPFSSFRLKG